MSLPSYTMYAHSFSLYREFRRVIIATVLLMTLFGCWSSGVLSMEQESNQATSTTAVSVLPADSPNVNDDGVPLVHQHTVDGLVSVSLTDAPVLLEPCATQMCGEVEIVPGTTRLIPYLIPLGWHCVGNQVQIVQEIPELSNLNYYVKPLPTDFSFRGKPHLGLLLYASVPPKYYNRKKRRVGSKIKSVTTSLKLILQVRLEPVTVPGDEDTGPSGGFAMGNDATSTASVSLSDRILSHHIAFGAAAWQEYFGVDVGQEPRLPSNIETILNSTSPFLLDEELAPQRIGENHLLTLIPSTVDGEVFTLDKLGALVLHNYNNHFKAFQGNSNKALGEYSHGYRWYSEYLNDATRHTPLKGAPYWVLLPKTVLEGSRDKSFSKQKAMVAKYKSHGYQVPCVLEVVTSLLAHYARSGGERLYSRERHSKGRWTYTRCSDVDKDNDPFVVGGFVTSGLFVNDSYADFYSTGIACFRKL